MIYCLIASTRVKRIKSLLLGKRFFVFLLFALVGLASETAVRADSWGLPETATYTAGDGSARLIVTPRVPSSQLAYFQDRVAGRAPAGPRPGDNQASARGRLERRDGRRWVPIWEGPLVNEVAPVSALVASQGRFFVTFDNWHSMGWGENVVVIYDSAGRVIRSLALTDLLPGYFVDALPRTTSSVHWAGENRIDDASQRLILLIVVPGPDVSGPDIGRDRREHFPIALDLATGMPDSLPEAAWGRAREGACRALIQSRGWQLRQDAFLRDPLRAPATADERAWHEYAREAIARLETPTPLPADAADDEVGAELLAGLLDTVEPTTTVLRDHEAADYSASLRWLREALAEPPHGPDDVRIFASPSQENLAAALAREASRVRLGSLAGVKIYAVLEDPYWPSVRAALAATGATLIQLDPTRPIAQKPERLAGREPVPELAHECQVLAVEPRR
jgi:hypothetical protein